MRSALNIVLIILFGHFVSVNAASEPVKLEIPVTSGLAEHADTLFVSPAYAALALQNIGLPISLSQPMKILSRQSFQVGPGKVSYVKKKDKVYYYTASMVLALGKEISVPVEIDLSDVDNGRLRIRAYPPLSGLIPQDMIVRVESKLQMLANANAQKQLIAYLAKRSGGKSDDANDQSRLFDAIAFDAYNQLGLFPAPGGSQSGREAGAAEPLSDQWSLIVAVIIWLVGFPLYLFIIRRQRAGLIIPARVE